VKSIAKQDHTPAEIIIVDDGDLSEDTVSTIINTVPDTVGLKLTESDGVPGSSVARNKGVDVATSPIVVFLDDDVILHPTYLERLKTLYEKNDSTKLAGIGGFDSDLRSPSVAERIFNKIFFLGEEGWKINSVGIQSWDPTIENPQNADWLSGNNASYKREILINNQFRQKEGGREALEDIDMGWELTKKGYHFIIDPGLKLDHNESPWTDSALDFGMKRGRNRYRIFHRHGDSSDWYLFVWCMLGDTLRHVFAPIIDRRIIYHLTVAFGMVVGLIQIGLSKR
jgi:GT2 family glycosyltransferase